jgi:phage tail protein X
MCVDCLARHLYASEIGGACHEQLLNHNPGKARYTTVAMSV